MTLPSSSRSRAGFTLIELLVVIAIIAVLVSLLGAGIFFAFTRMNETSAHNEISGMSAAMEAFYGQYKCYPPSQLRLCSNRAQYGQNGTNALDQVSLTFLTRMWPNIGAFQGIQWAGPGNTKVNEVLEGDQVLVFAFGGIPSQTAVGYQFNGFATNSRDPSLVVAGANVGKKGPFFTFNSGRIYARNSVNFPSFKDVFGFQPYVYVSANNIENGYDPYYPTPFAATVAAYALQLPNQNGTTATVTAYYTVAPTANGNTLVTRGTYLNPKTFQILCAGADGNFNDAGASTTAYMWTPTAVTTMPVIGQDDLSNFTDTRLGAGQ